MSVTEHPGTFGRARLSFANEQEIDEFVATLRRYERGEISADAWRQFRLVRGTYGQRQTEDAQMLRVKIPQGLLTEAQLIALAEVGERYSRGFGHITTRQNIQFHFVRLHDVEPAMRRLAEAGLTTREACGNSVRNITACPYAGVADDEAFDVTPYAEALTRYLLRHPLSSTLPRKFKTSFEGCPHDHVATPINDLGFRAVVGATGGRGFRVTVGGGTSILCTSGTVLHEFLPASEILRVAEAVLRVFHRLGDYQHKQRNRMKFLIRELGWTSWLEEYNFELSSVRGDGTVPVLTLSSLDAEPSDQPSDVTSDVSLTGITSDVPANSAEAESVENIAARVATARVKGPGITPVIVPVLRPGDELFARWRLTNIRPQKQHRFVTAVVSVPLGDLTSEQMRQVAAIAARHGDGAVRVTSDQDLVLRWIHSEAVRRVYDLLAAAGLGLAEAGTIADVASCPGAETCRLAVTHSRGLGRHLEDELRARPELIAAADRARIKISGCPNGCGQHHIATIGFQGSVRRLGSRAVPQYFVMVGGGVTNAGASFGRLVAKVPVRRAAVVVERLIDLYTTERDHDESAPEFFARVDLSVVKTLLGDLEALSEEDAVAADYVDLGDESEFIPVVMEGECSA